MLNTSVDGSTSGAGNCPVQVALNEGVALKAGEPRGVIQEISGCNPVASR